MSGTNVELKNSLSAPVVDSARPEPTYHADNLCVWLKDTNFLREERFQRAYRKGMDSGHKICREKGSREDIHIEWRVHVLCWAASHASRLAGDFVECGVNTGIYSLAIADYIDLDRTGKHLYLFDTFCGIPPSQMNERERSLNREVENETYYEECYETARANFAEYRNAVLIRGQVPDTLTQVAIDQVCYLSLDMNIVLPEIAAIKYFWPKLVTGAPVILDDYGWLGYAPQKVAMDEFAASVGCTILNMPTGQGLLIKS